MFKSKRYSFDDADILVLLDILVEYTLKCNKLRTEKAGYKEIRECRRIIEEVHEEIQKRKLELPGKTHRPN